MTRRPDSSDIEQEIEFHIQETVDALVASGMDEEAARTEAERRFGDRNQHDARMRSAHDAPPPERRRWASLWADVAAEVRLAARSLRRSPGFTIAGRGEREHGPYAMAGPRRAGGVFPHADARLTVPRGRRNS
jgi:hypothetical protein